MFALLMITAAFLLALGATWQVHRHTATGMTACMAAMMPAMGSGLALGYGVGMIWGLGMATLIGVLAGMFHGLWTGRRFGPMAALEGIGGGVMGGLMGPMLAIMLLFKSSLLPTAVVMLALQLVLNAGAFYAVAATNGIAHTGWLGLVGRVLGASSPESENACAHDESPVQVTGSQRHSRRARQAEAQRLAAERARRQKVATAVVSVGIGAFVLAGSGWLALNHAETPSEASGLAPTAATNVTAPQAASAASPAVASAGQKQEVALTLDYPLYAPSLLEVQHGVPVRLSIKANGDPG